LKGVLMENREIKKLIVLVSIVVVIVGVFSYFEPPQSLVEARNDFSDLSWTMAFEALHETLS
jgi:hypothetical protein